jgi:hypothetical protein
VSIVNVVNESVEGEIWRPSLLKPVVWTSIFIFLCSRLKHIQENHRQRKMVCIATDSKDKRNSLAVDTTKFSSSSRDNSGWLAGSSIDKCGLQLPSKIVQDKSICQRSVESKPIHDWRSHEATTLGKFLYSQEGLRSEIPWAILMKIGWRSKFSNLNDPSSVIGSS